MGMTAGITRGRVGRIDRGQNFIFLAASSTILDCSMEVTAGDFCDTREVGGRLRHDQDRGQNREPLHVGDVVTLMSRDVIPTTRTARPASSRLLLFDMVSECR